MSLRPVLSIGLGLASLGAVLAFGSQLFLERKIAASAEPGLMTAALAPPQTLGPSGLPLPRFVSLKAEKVNVRRGPSSDHKVAWVFQRRGLPVEIIAESDNWRRVRDSDGAEGWILQNMLTGKRTAVVAPWRPDGAVPLYSEREAGGGVVASLAAGVLGTVTGCDGRWCELKAGGYSGWAEQAQLWGVYPDETVDD